MKRQPETPVHEYLSRHRGWFAWQKCARCKTEFRREAGWKWLHGPWMGTPNGTHGHWSYLCFSCGGPTKATATECIVDIETRQHAALESSRPLPPQMPPSRWVRERG